MPATSRRGHPSPYQLQPEPTSVTKSKVLTPADEPLIIITRTVAAPRELVFRCYTDPVHLVHFWGPHGSSMPVCELDPRPGGVWRQVLQFREGGPFPVTYVFLEMEPPERIVFRDAPHGSAFGDPLPPATMVNTILLEAEGGATRVTSTVRMPNLAARDAIAATGFTSVVVEAGERLDDYLPTLQAQD
jgi:uncharacterized protein YndB with AHSA1/START domain